MTAATRLLEVFSSESGAPQLQEVSDDDIPPSRRKPVKLAAIDIGSNSVHMVVVELTGRRSFEIIDREKDMVKLGAGAFRGRQLTERAMNAGLDALRKYRKLADSLGVDEVIAVATAAIRETENGGEFLSRVGTETGIEPRLISGTDEARLIYQGVRNALDLGEEKVLVLDIGGGSVEVIVGDSRNLLLTESVKLGVQRLRDLLGDEPLSPKKRRYLETLIEQSAGPVLQLAKSLGFQRVIGTSGTIRALGIASHRAAGGEPWRTLNAEVANLRDIKRLSERLVSLPRKERGEIKGIDAQRSDTVHLGGVLLVQLLTLAEAEGITLCDASLREGVILDHISRRAETGGALLSISDLRPRSVAQLARKYGQTGVRERHVARLALQLFDQTVALHGLGPKERELLEYAALLFAVGQHIGFRDYQKHSAYIVQNSGIRGFTDEEVELIALTVLFHRKAEPSKKHVAVKKLKSQRRRAVKVLSAILRLAVGMDRSNTQDVKNVRAQLDDGMLRLELSGQVDLELAIWGARRRSDALGHALDVQVEIDRTPEEVAEPPNSSLDPAP